MKKLNFTLKVIIVLTLALLNLNTYSQSQIPTPKSHFGFVPGTEVYILQNLRRGPIIVRVHDARIALGREVARRIQIHRKEP